MATWMWLNLTLGAVFVLAIAGIPLWLVIKRPDVRHELDRELAHAGRLLHVPTPRAASDRTPHPVPAYANRAAQARRSQAQGLS